VFGSGLCRVAMLASRSLGSLESVPSARAELLLAQGQFQQRDGSLSFRIHWALAKKYGHRIPPTTLRAGSRYFRAYHKPKNQVVFSHTLKAVRPSRISHTGK
jgi:hypothetical protein